jgi:hypothetical protein
VTVETGWDLPTGRNRAWSWLGVVMDFVGATDGQSPQSWMFPATGAPKWRVIIMHPVTGVKLARSAWRRDWPEVERLQRAWQQQTASMTADEVVRGAARWDGA